MKNRYLLLIFILLLQALVIRAVSFEPTINTQQVAASISKIPHSFAGWDGIDYPLEPRIYDILETRSIIHRSYEKTDGQKVFLSVVYYAETKVGFHAPESCFGGRGISVSSSSDTVLIDKTNKVLTVNKLVQQSEKEKGSLIYYFFKAGPFMGSSYYKLRWNLMINKFNSLSRSGSLIRVSIKTNNYLNYEQEAEILDVFINDLRPYMLDYL